MCTHMNSRHTTTVAIVFAPVGSSSLSTHFICTARHVVHRSFQQRRYGVERCVLMGFGIKNIILFSSLRKHSKRVQPRLHMCTKEVGTLHQSTQSVIPYLSRGSTAEKRRGGGPGRGQQTTLVSRNTPLQCLPIDHKVNSL